MRALVKKHSQVGLWMDDVPMPTIGINDVMIQVLEHRNLRHRHSYLPMGQMGAEDNPRSNGRRSRIRRANRRSRLERSRLSSWRNRQRRRSRCLRPLSQLPGWPSASLQRHKRGRRESRWSIRGVYLAPNDQRVGARAKYSTRCCLDLRSVRQRSAYRRCRSMSWAKTCLITGAGPIGSDGAWRLCKHAGARHVVVTDVNPYRLDLAQQDGCNARG